MRWISSVNARARVDRGLNMRVASTHMALQGSGSTAIRQRRLLGACPTWIHGFHHSSFRYINYSTYTKDPFLIVDLR